MAEKSNFGLELRGYLDITNCPSLGKVFVIVKLEVSMTSQNDQNTRSDNSSQVSSVLGAL